jgi:hypothetical protein
VTLPHQPTEETREKVTSHARVGTPHEMIGRILGIDPKTLRKWYRDELDVSHSEANATIGGALFTKALNGDTSAQIFWMKTRAGFRESAHVDHTSSDGSMSPKPALDMSRLSPEALAEIVALGDAPDSA